ncbi:hypothetical protein [Paenisporosarcina quisquiliarum]|uniref:hypothetical protein n=1 Tax=Paenisporosarcina quisquiliarum TaxID=365346 RepID=UPI003736AA22
MIEISKIEARERNLEIKIIKQISEKKASINDVFTMEDISNIFYFRQSDKLKSMKKFFSKKGDKFRFNQGFKNKIQEVIEKQIASQNSFILLKDNYINLFATYRSEYQKNLFSSDTNQKFKNFYEKICPDLETLHWGLLPEYSESTIINRGLLPETDINEYYNHYHTLEDLYETLIGTMLQTNSLKGDVNLNKKMVFKVFSRRWGHEDHYSIERRIDGWYVKHLSINGLSKKDGTGSILDNLNQDSIQYPIDGVKYAFETLWEMADEQEMLVGELEEKLQEIANWISAIEKDVGLFQPNWCNYY